MRLSAFPGHTRFLCAIQPNIPLAILNVLKYAFVQLTCKVCHHLFSLGTHRHETVETCSAEGHRSKANLSQQGTMTTHLPDVAESAGPRSANQAIHHCCPPDDPACVADYISTCALLTYFIAYFALHCMSLPRASACALALDSLLRSALRSCFCSCLCSCFVHLLVALALHCLVLPLATLFLFVFSVCALACSAVFQSHSLSLACS